MLSDTHILFVCIRSLRERGQTFKHESSKYQSEISYTSPLFEHIRCLMLKVNGNGCGIICHGFLNKLNSTSILVVIVVVVGADDFTRCCSPVMNLRNIHSFSQSIHMSWYSVSHSHPQKSIHASTRWLSSNATTRAFRKNASNCYNKIILRYFFYSGFFYFILFVGELFVMALTMMLMCEWVSVCSPAKLRWLPGENTVFLYE